MLGAPYSGLCKPPSAVAVGCLSCQGSPRLPATAVLCLPLTGGKSPGVITPMLLLRPPLSSVPVICVTPTHCSPAVLGCFHSVFIILSLFFSLISV